MKTTVSVAKLLLLTVIVGACGTTAVRMPSSPPPAEITPAHRAALEFLAQHVVLRNVELRKLNERGPSAVSGTMVRFEQLHHGVPILGTLVVCEVTAARVRVITNELRDVDVDITPKITAKAAARIAARTVRFKGTTTPQLVILTAGKGGAVQTDTLAWWVIVEDGLQASEVFLDAKSGAVLSTRKVFPTD